MKLLVATTRVGGATVRRVAALLYCGGSYAMVPSDSKRSTGEHLRATTILFAAATCTEAHWSTPEVVAGSKEDGLHGGGATEAKPPHYLA